MQEPHRVTIATLALAEGKRSRLDSYTCHKGKLRNSRWSRLPPKIERASPGTPQATTGKRENTGKIVPQFPATTYGLMVKIPQSPPNSRPDISKHKCSRG